MLAAASFTCPHATTNKTKKREREGEKERERERERGGRRKQLYKSQKFKRLDVPSVTLEDGEVFGFMEGFHFECTSFS